MHFCTAPICTSHAFVLHRYVLLLYCTDTYRLLLCTAALQEAAYARELAEWDAKIRARTDELLALTRENTASLNAVSELTSAQRALEANLTQVGGGGG